jgi:hypothetical protein
MFYKCKNLKGGQGTAYDENFINEEKAGRYSIDDVTVRFSSAADSVSDDLIAVLRRLIDDGSVPPPQV